MPRAPNPKALSESTLFNDQTKRQPSPGWHSWSIVFVYDALGTLDFTPNFLAHGAFPESRGLTTAYSGDLFGLPYVNSPLPDQSWAWLAVREKRERLVRGEPCPSKQAGTKWDRCLAPCPAALEQQPSVIAVPAAPVGAVRQGSLYAPESLIT